MALEAIFFCVFLSETIKISKKFYGIFKKNPALTGFLLQNTTYINNLMSIKMDIQR